MSHFVIKVIVSVLYSTICTHSKQECQTQEKNKRSCTRLPLLKWKSNGSPHVTPESTPPVDFFFTTVFFQIILHMGNNIFDSDKSIEEAKSTEERAKQEDVETAKVVSDAPAKEESKDHSSRDCCLSCGEPSQSRLRVTAGIVAYLEINVNIFL